MPCCFVLLTSGARVDPQDLLLGSLRLLLALPPDVLLPLSNRLASGLLILIQVDTLEPMWWHEPL